jgi:salicylate hydroxylase
MVPGTVIVVGGGIAGVASAIALAQRGWRVQILEQADQFAEIGAGVQIGPNGVKVLQALGVMDLLEPYVFEPEHIELRDACADRQIFKLPMKGYAQRRWGARYLQVHRADLHRALCERLDQIAGKVVHLGTRIVKVTQEDQHATVLTSDDQRFAADVVIGADGIRSVVRDQVFATSAPLFTGNVAWRAVVPVEALGQAVPPPAGCVWAGRGRHAVTTLMRGGALANFVGISEEDAWQEEGWNIPGDKDQALALFGDWDPSLRRIVEQTEVLHRWALFTRAPLQTWAIGRIALIGDAAHPMLPSMAQGAVQALEDAWALAACLDVATDAEDALQAYVKRRHHRATAVQARSARNLDLFHMTGIKRFALYTALRLAGGVWPRFLHQQQSWIYGWDETVA